MYYIVQENTFREENYDALIQSLDRLGLEYEIVKVLPFIEDFEFNTTRKDVFVFGSLKLARISGKLGWFPGSYMNENHDFMVYKDFYKEHLLNYNSRICRFSDDLDWKSEYQFIRPTKDTKVFTGNTFSKDEWEKFVQHSMTNGHSTILDKDTLIQVSTTKNIQKEIRFWVVNGKVVTGSQYRLGSRVVSDPNFEPDAFEFAQKMVDISIGRRFRY